MAPFVHEIEKYTKNGLNAENTRQFILLTNCYYMMLDFVLGIVKGVNERDDTAIAENYVFALKMLDLIWRQEMNLLSPELSHSDYEYDTRSKLSKATSIVFSLWADCRKYSVKLVGSDDEFRSRILKLCGEKQAIMIKEAVEHGPMLSDDSGLKKRFLSALVKNIGDMADWLLDFYPHLIEVFSTNSIDTSYYGPLISDALPLALVSDRIRRMLKIENGRVEGLDDYYKPSKKLQEILENAHQEPKFLEYIGKAYDKAGESCGELAISSSAGFAGRVKRHDALIRRKMERHGH